MYSFHLGFAFSSSLFSLHEDGSNKMSTRPSLLSRRITWPTSANAPEAAAQLLRPRGGQAFRVSLCFVTFNSHDVVWSGFCHIVVSLMLVANEM